MRPIASERAGTQPASMFASHVEADLGGGRDLALGQAGSETPGMQRLGFRCWRGDCCAHAVSLSDTSATMG